MPTFSNHLIASFIALRWPSNSKHTMPISSVTLACRTLVITGNFWASSQITGFVINRGGYINHRRRFSLPAGLADLVAMLAAGNGGDDADFVAVFNRRLLILQETDVLFVHVNIHEASDG